MLEVQTPAMSIQEHAKLRASMPLPLSADEQLQQPMCPDNLPVFCKASSVLLK